MTMNASFSDSERAALGLNEVTFGEEQFVQATSGAAHGRAPVVAATLTALVAAANFSTPRVGAAERAGMRVSVCDDRPTVVRIVEEAGAEIHTRSLAGGEGWLHRDEQDVATVFVDLDCGRVVSVSRPDGSGVVLRAGANGFSVIDFYRFAGSIPPLSPVRAPLDEWSAACSDPWLVEELQRRSSLDDAWQHAVAAGLGMRLPAPPADAARQVNQILSGEVPREVSPIREWARQLSTQQTETLVDLGLAVADRVGGTVDDLYLEMAPAEPWWRSSLHAVCLERDDLECVRLVLVEGKAEGRVSGALDGLDMSGRRLIASIPRVLLLPDERLYRAQLADYEAWWATLAVPQEQA